MIKVDEKLKKLKNYKWLIDDCICILEELKVNNLINITFTSQEVGFGSRLGKLIIKDNNSIIVVKNYNYIDNTLKDINFTYKDNMLFFNT